MDRRSLLVQTAGWVTVAATGARADAPPGVKRRLGVLLLDSSESWAFLPPQLRKELAVLGWTENKNLTLDWRYANGDTALLRDLAARLVASAPDAILTRGTPATRALQHQTRTVSILTGVGDPVGAGFAKSYAQPGGNITGISYAQVESSGKHVELLRALAPGLAGLRILISKNRAPFIEDITGPIKATARMSGLDTRTFYVDEASELHAALRTDRGGGEVGAVVYGLGGDLSYASIADAALAARMPTMFEHRRYVDAGGLASFRLDWDNQTQRTAAQIDKVFRGEKPGQIPFELPTRPEFVLNRKTARALGLALPQSLLLLADAVVD